MNQREISISAKFTQTAAIFVVTSVIALLVLSKATLRDWEDHFQIGRNLRTTGALMVDGVPSIFRPPGFPVFVAASLWVGDALSAPENAPQSRSWDRDLRTVVSVQGILLGAMAAALFFWASRRSGPVVAAGVALAAALNPYSLATASVATYHLLFVVLATFATLALFPLLRRSRSLVRTSGLAGVLWGLTSLTKPVALIIPVFVAPLLLVRLPWWAAVKSSALLVAGMVLIIGPYVVRNYLVTGQAFVTAQGGITIWGSTVEKMRSDQPFLVWQPIWWKSGMPIFTRVTGSPVFSDAIQNAYVLPLNAEFAKEARDNIIAAPQIYFYNVLRNLVSFNLDTMGFWHKYLISHNKRLVETLSEIWIVSLMTMAAAGVAWGCARQDDCAMTVATIYIWTVVAHSISFATELYTISKFPLLVLGFALLLMRLENMPRHGVLARTTACIMATLALTISVLAA